MSALPLELSGEEMSPTDVAPTPRLLRAAAAEREDIQHRREKLVRAREETLAQLAKLEEALQTLDERDLLLARLSPDPAANGDVAHLLARGGGRGPDRSRGDNPAAPGRGDAPGGENEQSSRRVLRGPQIREKAVQLFIAFGRGEALHYRKWFELLHSAGYEVAGKNPQAVFLTQLSRSPVVRKALEPGVYELDRSAKPRISAQLERAQAALRELSAGTQPAEDRSTTRERREMLVADISRLERALDEAERVLRPPSGSAPAVADGS